MGFLSQKVCGIPEALTGRTGKIRLGTGRLADKKEVHVRLSVSRI